MTFDPRTQPPVPDGYIGDGSGPTGYLLKVNADGSINTGGGTAGSPSSDVGSVQGVAGGTPITTLPGAPAAANILNNGISAPGVLITIPAGRTWIGFVSCGGSIVVAPGTTSSAVGTVSVVTGGAGVTPTNPVCYIELAAPGSATSGVGTIGQDHDFTPNVVVIAPVGNAVTLSLAASGTSSNWAKAFGALQ